MVIVFNHCNTKPFKPTESMELADLEHNEKFISLQIQELENEIALLQQNMITKKILLRIDKYQKQILIYSKQLQETKKQIKKWKI